MITKLIASILSLLLIGCATTETPPRTEDAAKGKRAKAAPSLDRTYDWGARPPVSAPDRQKD